MRFYQSEALIAAHIGDAPDHADIRRALASHAGRIPLFIEEVLRELQAKGDLIAGYDVNIGLRKLCWSGSERYRLREISRNLLRSAAS